MIGEGNGQRAGDGAAGEEDLAGFEDIVGRLRRLGAAVNRMRYPGEAWPVRRAPERGRIACTMLAAAGAAAAAAVVAAVTTAYWFLASGKPSAPPPLAPPQVAARAVAEGEGELAESSPAVRFDPSIAAQIRWILPSVSLPPTVDPNGPAWSVPQFAFPSLESSVVGESPGTTTRPESSG